MNSSGGALGGFAERRKGRGKRGGGAREEEEGER
jgi:hypothetical protein